MTIEQSVRTGISRFNDRQRETGRNALSSVESNMLAHIMTNAVTEEIRAIRNEMEAASALADIEMQRELDWATDVIIATIRMDNKMSVQVSADDIRKHSAGFNLRVEHDEGQIDLELVRASGVDNG